MTNNKRSGFTIIELMIVMAFLALLMMAVLMTTMYIAKIYTKGMTLKNINTVGRSAVDTIRRDFAASASGGVAVVTVTDSTGNVQNGRICLTDVTYVWNSARQLNTGGASLVKSGSDAAHLMRINHPSVNYCEKDSTGKYPDVIASGVSELLTGDGTDFAVHRIETAMITDPQLPQQLWSFDIEIGTNQQDTTTITSDGSTMCKATVESAANFDYCAVAEFSTVMKVGSGTL